MTLSPNNDPMGQAIIDFTNNKSQRLIVRSSMFDDDEMPVDALFRTETQMPPLERMALHLCKGKVLDVGAGAGCHTLTLEARGMEVTSIDISPLSTETRRQRGAKHALCADFFTDELGSDDFDTILLLMNGLGIAGTLAKLPTLLNRCKELLADGGQVIADSSDIKYLFEEEDGSYCFPDTNTYYGEVDYQMIYGKTKRKPFNWLYVDFDTLAHVAKACGMKAEKIADGKHFDYLTKITMA